jgi:SAM-dependent methyltransferase
VASAHANKYKQRKTVAFFSIRTGQFTYFSIQVGEGDWRGKEVLDFGGNVGNILRDPNSTIDEERYWCVDLDREAIERGRAAYPKAHWVFYDRYCFGFNSHGIPRLPIPDLRQTFDYIVAFSVFTNTTETDMLELVSQLEDLLAPGGALAFTFIDPFYFSSLEQSNFQWRLELELERRNITADEMEEIGRRVRGAKWFMLVNSNDLYLETEKIRPYEPEQQKTCYVYHTEEYMRKLFPRATILPPVNGEKHHCCIIRKA